MKITEAIKHIVCYEQKDFIIQITSTIKTMEDDGLETYIAYAHGQGTFEAIVVGKRAVKEDEQKTNVERDAESTEKPKQSKTTRARQVQGLSKKQAQ